MLLLCSKPYGFPILLKTIYTLYNGLQERPYDIFPV